jgi:hypothetical protein
MWLFLRYGCFTFADISNQKIYVLMKQSLIITAIICFVLGESFSFIAKRSNQKNNTKTYICSKICNDIKAGKKVTDPAQAEPYLPMVNMLRYL